MPDTTAAPLSDAQPKSGPALSATSDMPVIDITANTGDDAQAAADAEAEAARVAADAKDDIQADDEATRKAREDKRVPVGEVTKERKAKQEAREAAAAEKLRADAADARADALSKSLEALTKKEIPEDRPKRADFDDPDIYDAAVDAWNDARVEAAKADAVKDSKADDARKAAQTRQEQLAENFRTSIEKFKEDHPDFDEVFDDSVTTTMTMALAIAESDASAAISYWLGQNKDEATRIATLSPAAQIKAIARIELIELAKESTPTAKPKPVPIKPLGQRSGSSGKSVDEMNTDEYAAHRNAQLRAERGGATAH